MNVDKILDIAVNYHKGQFRKDGVTPYINHPLAICKKLFELGITTNEYNKKLDMQDFKYYSVALLHDVLEDTKITEQELNKCVCPYTYTRVKALTCEKTDNPFYKMEYLQNIVNHEDERVFIIKVIDRICNVEDFVKDKNEKYAKIYFHKADILWNKLFEKKHIYNKLWEEVIRLNNYLEIVNSN